jgi:hypothetical protein
MPPQVFHIKPILKKVNTLQHIRPALYNTIERYDPMTNAGLLAVAKGLNP